MATDVFDEHRFTSQTSLYEQSRTRLTKDSSRRTISGSSTTIYETSNATTTTRQRRLRYSTQTTLPGNSMQQRHSVSNDLFSLFRSLAIKPFRATTMTNTLVEGQTNQVLNGNSANPKTPVSLLKIRPLSENIIDPTTSSSTDSNRVCIYRNSKFVENSFFFTIIDKPKNVLFFMCVNVLRSVHTHSKEQSARLSRKKSQTTIGLIRVEYHFEDFNLESTI